MPSDNNDETNYSTSLIDVFNVPFLYLILFYEFVYGCIVNAVYGLDRVLDYSYIIPYFSPKAMFLWKSPIGFTNLKSLNYRYWITALAVAYFAFYPNITGWYIQRGINLIREQCLCDIIRMNVIGPAYEGAWLMSTEDRWSKFNYLMRRFICYFLKI